MARHADGCSRSTSARDQHSRRLQGQAGFTLVEVIVVLSIMGLIMALVGPRVLGYLTDSKEKMARIQVETLSNATELFFIDNGRYPLEPEGLQALLAAPASLPTWRGPYLKGTAVPADPWGRPYRYSSKDRGRSYIISMEGASDKDEGSAPKRLSSARPQGGGREGSY
ncbi:type II secretion system major pseudopilin GspG [Microvirga aerilata]|uniref:Type II secretion system major pseudopilin GspG n=2 Tax=Microvirga aerilata TaxID=670292 RepID=A0A937CZ61_9HYPH|nr:type II secretion system major pseudopilin GspG [Microvirga aerilata]